MKEPVKEPDTDRTIPENNTRTYEIRPDYISWIRVKKGKVKIFFLNDDGTEKSWQPQILEEESRWSWEGRSKGNNPDWKVKAVSSPEAVISFRQERR